MEVIDYTAGVEDLPGKIARCVESRASFCIANVSGGKQSMVVGVVEDAIEKAGLKCRVRTENRGWLAAAATVASLGTAAVAAAAIGVHNLATKDPDYEVVKELVGSDVTVNYMK